MAKKKRAPQKTCPKCKSKMHAAKRECPKCHYRFKIAKRKVTPKKRAVAKTSQAPNLKQQLKKERENLQKRIGAIDSLLKTYG